MNLENFKSQCEKSIKPFEEKIGFFEYISNGILLWEGLAFCSLLDMLGIEMIIESGIAGGRSTEIWAKYFPGKIFALDNARYYGKGRFEETKNRLAKYPNLEVLNGDAFILIEDLIKKNPDKKIALFIDGPKGEDAAIVVRQAFRYKNVLFAAVHDEAKPGTYHLLDKWFKGVFYSDEKWFVDKYSYLDKRIDDPVLKADLEKNPGGFGLGAAFNEKGLELGSDSLKHRLAYYFFRARAKGRSLRDSFKKDSK